MYTAGTKVESSDGSTIYECKATHTSNSTTEPGSGGSWSTAWAVYSKTGSGFWSEGRWEFQFVKSDGTAIDAGDRNQTRVTDPISGSLVYTDQRYSAAPNAAFIFYSPGTYKARVRYQNRDKDWSAWAESSSITVSQNTRTKRYVNGRTGSDSNSGKSSGAAKATLSGALSLVTADNFDIEIADGTSCDVTASINVGAYSGIYIHRSGEGSAPVVVLRTDGCLTPGSDFLIDGVVFEYSGSATYALSSFGASKENITFANIVMNEASSLAEISSAALPKGLLLFKCQTTKKLDRYTLFVHDVECLSILGCTFAKGSGSEHSVRISSGNGTTTGAGYSQYVSIDYSTINYDSSGLKSSLRCYARMVGAYRSVLANGEITIGDKDNSTQEFRDYCFDGCKIDFSGSGVLQFVIYNNAVRIVMRTSFFKKAMYRASGVINFDESAGNSARTISGVRLLNLSVSNTGTGNDGPLIYQTSITPATDVLVRGCIWYNDDAEFTYQPPFYLGTTAGCADGWLFEDCVHSVLADQGDFKAGPGSYTVSQANSELWADGLIQEDHTFDADGQPLGSGSAWKTAVRSSVGVFLSLNGLEWVNVGPAGAWYPPPS